MVRVFVGIVIPEDIKRSVVEVQNLLKSLSTKSKFVEPENLHISLTFLGDTEETELEKIKFQLDEICESHKKFELIINGLLLIPNEKFTRVIAMNIKSDELEKLRKEVHQTINGKSNPSHLTLCRVKSISDKNEFIKKVKTFVLNQIKMNVDKIHLLESTLQKSGPVYSILHESYLK